MNLPSDFIESLAGIPGFKRDTFIRSHAEGNTLTSIRLNPSKKINRSSPPDDQSFTPVPWTSLGYYLGRRPSFTFDPLFHAGCYYVQEASSMFLEQALKQTVPLHEPLRVLDISAAPGGKSTHIQSLISPESLLVSNEVIRSRALVLRDNIIKWGGGNVVVTNNDPEDFTQLENYFDLIVADAPCSGSGLFRKEPDAVNEWSLNQVQLCSKRQQRILADIIPALRPGGVLVYSTCSYSREEDEEIVEWLLREFDLDYQPLVIDPSWGITDTGKGYRFWPDQVRGEGFFLACLRRRKQSEGADLRRGTTQKMNEPGKKETEMILHWIEGAGKKFIRHDNTVYAWPGDLVYDFSFLLRKLKVMYSGVKAGELVRDKMIPDHALALSGWVTTAIPRAELNLEQAIRYLQRRELEWKGDGTGWMLVVFQQQPLGWVNVLHNRINNYYPKELRILKDR
ncbi:MAG: methyltransferase RsmF C-terminal domain-like protein [Chitinophagaceae bacterium]